MDLLYFLPDFWVSISRLQHPRHWSLPIGGAQLVGSHLRFQGRTNWGKISWRKHDGTKWCLREWVLVSVLSMELVCNISFALHTWIIGIQSDSLYQKLLNDKNGCKPHPTWDEFSKLGHCSHGTFQVNGQPTRASKHMSRCISYWNWMDFKRFPWIFMEFLH